MDVHERRRLVACCAERVDDTTRNLEPRLRLDNPFLALELEADRPAEHEEAVRMPVVHVQRRGGRLGRHAGARRTETARVSEQHDPELGAVCQQLARLHLHDASA